MTGTEFEVDDEEEKVDMCEAIKGMIEDASKEKWQKGMQEERIAMAKRMLEEGSSSVEFIARITTLSAKEIRTLAAE